VGGSCVDIPPQAVLALAVVIPWEQVGVAEIARPAAVPDLTVIILTNESRSQPDGLAELALLIALP
jgi:hypothetical protein